MNKYVLLGLFWFLIGHIAVFFQLNGQFKWEWFKENTFITHYLVYQYHIFTYGELLNIQ